MVSGMSKHTLSLYTDRLEPKAERNLPGCNRVIYVCDGDAVLRSGSQAAGLAAGSERNNDAHRPVRITRGGVRRVCRNAERSQR